MSVRSNSDEVLARLFDALEHGLGPDVRQALDDPDVLEVTRNPDGLLWVDTLSHGRRCLDASMSDLEAEALITTVAHGFGRDVSENQPSLEAKLPFRGFRFTGVLPPVSPRPMIAIRKSPPRVFDLERDYVPEILSPQDLELLRSSIAAKKNILISGGTGTGKTALANSLMQERERIRPDSRVAILEDTPELKPPGRNCFCLYATPAMPLRALLRLVLRLSPDHIDIGEVRGAEALDLYKAWNTGHPGGFATLHANNAAEALLRFDHLIQEAGVPSQAPRLLATVHLVVHLERHGHRRRAEQIAVPQAVNPDGSFTLRPIGGFACPGPC